MLCCGCCFLLTSIISTLGMLCVGSICTGLSSLLAGIACLGTSSGSIVSWIMGIVHWLATLGGIGGLISSLIQWVVHALQVILTGVCSFNPA
jgi:fructose-specific phosphotransferase system IIC component